MPRLLLLLLPFDVTKMCSVAGLDGESEGSIQEMKRKILVKMDANQCRHLTAAQKNSTAPCLHVLTYQDSHHLSCLHHQRSQVGEKRYPC